MTGYDLSHMADLAPRDRAAALDLTQEDSRTFLRTFLNGNMGGLASWAGPTSADMEMYLTQLRRAEEDASSMDDPVERAKIRSSIARTGAMLAKLAQSRAHKQVDVAIAGAGLAQRHEHAHQHAHVHLSDDEARRMAEASGLTHLLPPRLRGAP